MSGSSLFSFGSGGFSFTNIFRRNISKVSKVNEASSPETEKPSFSSKDHTDVHDVSSSDIFEYNIQAITTRLFVPPKDTLILFDWDDTLFPTSWLIFNFRNSKDTARIAQLLTASQKSLLRALEIRCLEILRLAMCLGEVRIVTHASLLWVIESCESLMPQLYKFMILHGFLDPKKRIIACFDSYLYMTDKPYPKPMWKKLAFSTLAKRMFDGVLPSHPRSIVSVGDGVAELQAAQYLENAWLHRNIPSLRKVIKFEEDNPLLESLIRQISHTLTIFSSLCKFESSIEAYISTPNDVVYSWKAISSFIKGESHPELLDGADKCSRKVFYPQTDPRLAAILLSIKNSATPNSEQATPSLTPPAAAISSPRSSSTLLASVVSSNNPTNVESTVTTAALRTFQERQQLAVETAALERSSHAIDTFHLERMRERAQDILMHPNTSPEGISHRTSSAVPIRISPSVCNEPKHTVHAPKQPALGPSSDFNDIVTYSDSSRMAVSGMHNDSNNQIPSNSQLSTSIGDKGRVVVETISRRFSLPNNTSQMAAKHALNVLSLGERNHTTLKIEQSMIDIKNTPISSPTSSHLAAASPSFFSPTPPSLNPPLANQARRSSFISASRFFARGPISSPVCNLVNHSGDSLPPSDSTTDSCTGSSISHCTRYSAPPAAIATRTVPCASRPRRSGRPQSHANRVANRVELPAVARRPNVIAAHSQSVTNSSSARNVNHTVYTSTSLQQVYH